MQMKDVNNEKKTQIEGKNENATKWKKSGQIGADSFKLESIYWFLSSHCFSIEFHFSIDMANNKMNNNICATNSS